MKKIGICISMESFVHWRNKPNKFIKAWLTLSQISEVKVPVQQGQFFTLPVWKESSNIQSMHIN
jgi:hypothetical protein